MMQPLPAFVFWLCGGSGLLLIALALPLWLRRVPPNGLYGARFGSALADPQVWYAINARAGRNLAVIGAVYLILVAAIAVIPSWNRAAWLLGVTALLVLALIGNTIRLGKAASRLQTMGARERPR